MKEGDILLAALRQADGTLKLRPVLFLKRVPPFQDFLVCGISTQLQHKVSNFDELINADVADYRESGLKRPSIVRIGYLAVLPRNEFQGRIGSITTDRLNRILSTLSDFFRPKT